MAMEGREEEVNTMAGLGETMCEELRRRAEVLYRSIHDPETPHE